MNQCKLVKELRRLKESSKEAVEGIETFSQFKRYMHVERNVEKELVDLLNTLNENYVQKQLVLVCGSVGDGKSHVISQIKNCKSHLLDGFLIHNDATESDHPSKTYLETLDEKFDAFSDERIDDDGAYRLIVAINLGTLSNFIETEPYASKYSILKEYVQQNKIIENEIVQPKKSSKISYINFSDYALYELTDMGPKSSFIEAILDKIVYENEENIFSKIFRSECVSSCPYKELCAVRYNYEMLFNSTLRSQLSRVIIEGLVKHKVILSVRSLLDFIYSIIVPREFEGYSDAKHLDQFFKDKGGYADVITFLMPNLLYEQSKRSPLFTAIYNEDPLNNRTEAIDQLIIDVNIARDSIALLEEKFDDDQYFILHNLFRNSLEEHVEKNILITSYLRFAKLFKDKIVEAEGYYSTYMIYLYHYNNGNIKSYSQLYTDVMQAIYAWNGRTDGNWINISVTGQKSNYQLSQEMKIEPAITKVGESDNLKDVNKFSTEIRLSLKNKSKSESVGFIIDFDLYWLIMKVRQGYRLNHNDKENYISFIESIDKLMSLGDMKESLRITHKKNKYNMDYILKKDIFGGYTFESN